MKRFHVHVHVDNLAKSIAFYSQLFAAQPARVEGDYAKWMLDDPAVNFAISTRGAQAGIDHLGIQTDDPSELATMKARAEAAGMAMLDEGETTCCYARSEKHWVTDPAGIAWEQFHTLSSIPVFREAAPAAGACCAPAAEAEAAVTAPAAKATVAAAEAAGGCCPPAPRGKPLGIPVKSAGSCC
jgi:predicted enzyme related to lactoylglutathione lyase